MTVASDEHGRPVHLEIRMSRAGGVLRGLLDSLAVSVSLGLQRGVPLSGYVEQLALARFEPCADCGDIALPAALAASRQPAPPPAQ